MVRLVLFLVLFILIARAFWRVVDSVIEAASGQAPRGAGGSGRAPAAKMARDPVCGTFVLPEHSLSIADTRGRVYFCSESCRDAYRAKSA
jgi:YHS domain-containing protein